MNRFDEFLLGPDSIEGKAATDLCYSKNRSLMGRCAKSLAGIGLKKIVASGAITLLFVSTYAVAQGQGNLTPQTQPVNYTNVIQIGPRDA